MKVLLIDADKTGFPNLALMKLSAWHKQKGDKTFLNEGCSNPDKIYVSCIFPMNAPIALGITTIFDCPAITGGSGINMRTILPNEIEHILPDYSLYNIDYSMGFTSRGCIRKCPWCIVSKKEGYIRDHASIKEFLHPDHKKVILLDNNFMASPKWKENLELIIKQRLKVHFNQGLDIRLITEENAKLLAETMYRSIRFKGIQLHFAFDSLSYENELRKGVKVLKDAGIKFRYITFYILVGFNSTLEEDFKRVEIIKELGLDSPYIMRYNGRRDIRMLNMLARWCNSRQIYRKTSFRNYKKGYSQKIIQAYLEEHPNSALGRI